MFNIRYVNDTDKPFWYTLDSHLDENEFSLKVRDGRGYIIFDDDKPVGVMRHNLFWDSIPFLTLIFIEENYRSKGFGRKAMRFWEREMRDLGYKMVMTSTESDENAQHFYRKLGYIDKGSILFDNTPYEQPIELIMMKKL